MFCSAEATAESRVEMESAHVTAVAQVFAELCRPDFDGDMTAAVSKAADSGFAFAEALATIQASCVSTGAAFGCAAASAAAEAWAAASAEAHATAVAASAEECGCLAGAAALSVGTATTFVELIADAFARAEVTACSEGDAESFAGAFAQCSAFSYAKVWTRVRAARMHERAPV